MANQGYIKLYRQIQDSYLWQDKPFSKGQAWIDLLLRANHKEGKLMFENKLVTIQRGSFHTSIVKLAEAWGWDKRKVSNYLNVLASDEMIIKKCTTHGTTITIVKYDDFQDSCTTDCTTDVLQHVPPLYTNNNDKNVNNNIKRFSRNKQFNSMEQQDYDFDLLEKKGTK